MAKVRHVELTVVCHNYDPKHRGGSAHVEIRDRDAPPRDFTGIRSLGDAFLFVYGFKSVLESEARSGKQPIEVTVSVSGHVWENPHFRKGCATAHTYGRTGKGFLIAGS